MSNTKCGIADRGDLGNRAIIAHLLLASCITVLITGYHKNLAWLWSRWMLNPDYSHGPIIPLISGYIVFLKRDRLRRMVSEKSFGGLVLIVFAFIVQVASIRMQINFTESYAFILSLAGAIWFLFGRKVVAEMIFPLCFLLFMVPFWGVAISGLSSALKALSSLSSYQLISLMGIPINREGVILHLTSGSLEVADPCSGIRSLMSLLAIGTVLAYFSIMHWIKKLALVLSAILFSFIWNTVRVVAFGIIQETTGVTIANGFWHTFMGGMVFVLALLSLFAVRTWILSK